VRFKHLEELSQPGVGIRILKEISQYEAHDFWNGRLLMWKPPENGRAYALGVDVGGGVGGDRSVIEVIALGDRRAPDEQVAEFASDFHGPLDLSAVVNLVGRMYCDDEKDEALATIECNSIAGGDITQQDLRTRLDYGNLFVRKAYDKINNIWTTKLGWMTTRTTRPKLIARGVHAFGRGDLIIRSPFLLDEMADFERDHHIAQAKSLSGTHDDRVMAMLIGYWGAHDSEWLSGDDVGEARRVLTDARKVSEDSSAASGRKPDWQNTACTYKEMMASWDAALFGD
jgi:hypothetical protein